MDHESALDLIYEDSLSDYELSEDEELDEVLPRKFQSMEIDTYGDYEEGELPPEAGTCDSSRAVVSFDSGTGHAQQDVAGQSLDEAIKEAKVNHFNIVRSDFAGQNNNATQQRRHKSKNKKRKRDSISRFVIAACKDLKEPKPALVRAAVDKLGLPHFKKLMNEVDVIEGCGGQMTVDGGRRRTPGGVLWNILKSSVGPDVYKDIMYQGRAAEKEKVHANARRQRPSGSDARANAQSRDVQMHQPAVHKAKQRKVKAYRPVDRPVASEGEDLTPSLDNLAVPQHAQNAWSEGVLKSRCVVEKSEAGGVASSGTGGECTETQKKKLPIAERLRFPVQYDDLLEVSLSGSQSVEGAVPAYDEPNEEKAAM